MSKQPEALRLAGLIEHYNSGVHSQAIVEDYSKAADELRRLHALAEPEQEPVAWLSQGGDVSRSKKHFDEMGFVDSIPLYTSPPAIKPLTDEQIEAISKAIERSDFFDCVVPFARAIERAHGIGDE